MTKTNALATMDSVRTLEGMVFEPVKILEELGYTYTGVTSPALDTTVYKKKEVKINEQIGCH